MKRISFLIFLSSFGIYLYSSAPALAPYRDMGEMVSVSHTLGVAHPPGYPAYTLFGKISTLISIANPSYRLNLISVLGGALACMLFFLILLRLEIPLAAALLAAILWLANPGFWIISIVTEMYSLNVAAALVLIYLWLKWSESLDLKMVMLMAFLGGFLSGFRMDLLLLGPAIALTILAKVWKADRRNFLATAVFCGAFFALGFSIYLYLLVRSGQSPFLNWNRPETLERLWGSLIRKSHGGTLDLLSVNYRPGELFWTDMGIYFKQILHGTFIFGIPLIFLGWYRLWQEKRAFFCFTLLAWAVSGPFFIYKANLPPNPHALAVLEAHFNLATVFILIWIGAGLGFLLRSHIRLATFLALPLLCGVAWRWQAVSKRHNYFGVDYARNVFRTLPLKSVLIMKKDVQLFLFWALQNAGGIRKDVSVVARGLAASPWYISMNQDRKFPVHLGPLKSEDDFLRFAQVNSGFPIFAGWEEEIPVSSRYLQIPVGLVRKILPAPSKESMAAFPDYLKEFYVCRGDCNYESQKDFFTSDLIDDYSKAHFARGEWSESIALHSDNPGPYYRRGFDYFQKDEFDQALRDYVRAEALYEKTYLETRDFHSLPDVVEGVRSEWSQVLLNLGVVLEKLGRFEDSGNAYFKALQIMPGLAQAHYNLAVLYWNRDWDKTVSHLAHTLKIDPHHQMALEFYPKALAARQRSGKASAR